MNFIKTLALAATILFAYTLLNISNASNYIEGKHYVVVSEQASKKQELREYFSYYCPACRAYEAYLPDFKKQMPSGAKIKKVHVDFMGHTTPEIQFMMAKALIIAEKTGLDNKFSSALFKHLQTDRKKINDEDDLKAIYTSIGGNAEKFDKGINNFSVVSQAKRNKKTQDKLSASRQLTSVPTMVVNGKYLIKAKALNQDNFIEDYKAIIAYLFTL